jgi:hypothetical protein
MQQMLSAQIVAFSKHPCHMSNHMSHPVDVLLYPSVEKAGSICK